MMEEYYKILDKNVIARRDGFLSASIYDPRTGWAPDTEHILADRLTGYDGEEIGSTDTLLQVETITKAEALRLISA